MIRRQHQKGDAASEAVYSDCERFRYSLSRVWASAGPRVLFILLNPSTATELHNDPTVERCERRARALGFGAFEVANIFAYRATDPRAMRAAADAIGPDNDQAVFDAASRADMVICGWGGHGIHLDRGADIAARLRAAGVALHHLGMTRNGQPRHPLYLGYDIQPVLWA